MGMRDARSDNVQRKMFNNISEMFTNLPQSSTLHTVTNNVQRKMSKHFFEKVHNVQQWWGEMFGMICITWSPMHLFYRCIGFSEFTMFNKVQDPYEILRLAMGRGRAERCSMINSNDVQIFFPMFATTMFNNVQNVQQWVGEMRDALWQWRPDLAISPPPHPPITNAPL